jgi:ribosome-binding protein aMBF1 (putative translation factor)
MPGVRGGRGDGGAPFRFMGDGMKTTKCPVCDWEIKDKGIKVKVGGKEITVCCDDCAKKAKEDPAKRSGANK